MNAPDYTSIYNQQVAQAQNAIAPQIQTLQAGTKTLADQYNTLISQLQGNQQNDIGAQQTTTSREFGARGIPLSSGVFGQTLNTELGSINRAYAGQFNQAGANYQNSLQNIYQQIAGLQSGALQNAAQSAQNLYGVENSNYQNELDRQAQAQQNALNRSVSYASSANNQANSQQKAQVAAFNSAINRIISGSDPAAAENALYNFLEKRDANGNSGVDIANALGIDLAPIWAVWNKLVSQAKAKGTYGKAPSSNSAASILGG